jgi:hypothetical protein
MECFHERSRETGAIAGVEESRKESEKVQKWRTMAHSPEE